MAKPGCVSFEGEDKAYPHYLFVNFSVYVENREDKRPRRDLKQLWMGA